ncbi:MAG: PD-(D/E)XK nuclease family protein, partial [Fidelibacterota bacterium]
NHLHVSGESTEYLGAAFGTFIHWVIEHQFFDTQSNHHILEQKAASLGIDDSVISTQGWMAYIRNIANMDAITRLSELAENKKFNEHPMECELISPDGEIKIALSGVIDTLYEYDHSWVVRDYKTDTTDIRLSQYVLQVQIYLQMVKWLYQVEQVSGELVFTTQGKVIPVDFNPDFFSSLHILGKTGWTLSLPSVENLKLPNILNNPTESLIVISPTRFRISVLRQAMANQQWLRPDIIFDTMVSLNRRINSDTSPKSLVRLLLRKLLKNEYQGRSFSEFPGLLSSLTQAYEWFDKSGLEPNDNLGHTFQLVREALVQKGYYPYLSIEHANWDYIKDKHIVFDGWLPVTKKDIDFTELARKFADGVDILEAAEIEDIEVNHSWYNPFDTEDEIRFIASQIQQLLHAGTPIDEIVIVLPSMEKLVPRLAYIFREKQIPFKLSKGEPVLERPVIQACMRLLSFFGRTKYKWTDLSAWFNHPLSWAAENYDQRDNFHRGLKQIDILFRRREKSKVALSPQFILQEISDYLRQYPNTEIETAWNFIRDQFQIWQSGTDPVHLVFNRYINRLIAVYPSSDEIEKSALNVFLSALDELNNLITGEHWMSSIQVYRLELAELLKNQDVPTPVQHDGISVLSVLDSLNNIDGKIVFVPGLSKADFPIVSSAGFLIPDIYDYHFHNHLKIFNYWLKTSKQLCLSCAGRDGDGNEQPHSLFLENLERIPVENPVKNPFSAASGKYISHDQSRSGLWDRQIRRHNAMVKNPFISSYFGKIKSDQIQNMLPYLSASQLSVLQETPLLFLMKYIWKIMETDPETTTPLLVGNLIHQILDRFGKCNPDGWTLNRSDHNAACELLYKLSVTEMDHWSAQHFEVKYLMKPFLMGLTQDTENPGLFKRLLQEDLAYMKNFRFMASEQKFGNSESSDDNSFPPLVFHHPELGDLKIRGTIDRLDHVPGRCILGTDYKTGAIQSANDVSELNPQLQVYYLAVKANYPDSTVVMNYRQLKSLKDKKFGFTNHWLGDIDAETYLHELISRQKKLPFISETITKEITDNFLKILSPLVSGEFRLWTTAIPQKLVKYYYLEGPSRINSIRYVGGSD